MFIHRRGSLLYFCADFWLGSTMMVSLKKKKITDRHGRVCPAIPYKTTSLAYIIYLYRLYLTPLRSFIPRILIYRTRIILLYTVKPRISEHNIYFLLLQTSRVQIPYYTYRRSTSRLCITCHCVWRRYYNNILIRKIYNLLFSKTLTGLRVS